MLDDLVALVNAHEALKAICPRADMKPDPRYMLVHKLMSKLAYKLNEETPLPTLEELQELDQKYSEIPDRPIFYC